MSSSNDFWTSIQNTSLPIVLYGTGNGADRVVDEFSRRGIRIEACFASDGFVRDRVFRGFKVISYKEARECYGRMSIVLGFGTHDRAVIENIRHIAGENDFYMPDLLEDESGNIFDREYYERNREDIESIIPLLSDDISRRSYQSIIDFRLSGRINYLFEDQMEDIDAWKLLAIKSDESFIDLGAYNGDTINRFLSFTDSYKKIIALEPDKRSFRKLLKNTEGLENIILYNAAISDKNGNIPFSAGRGRGSNGVKGNVLDEIDSVTIDSIAGDGASIIKFDTEGFEREALLGGVNTIRRYKPRMAISIYHKIDDLWKLPKLVLDINPEYKLYIRKSIALPYWDTCLYSI